MMFNDVSHEPNRQTWCFSGDFSGTWHGSASDARSGMKFHQSLAQGFLIAIRCDPQLSPELFPPVFSTVVDTAIGR